MLDCFDMQGDRGGRCCFTWKETFAGIGYMHFKEEEDNPCTNGNGTCARYAKGILSVVIIDISQFWIAKLTVHAHVVN